MNAHPGRPVVICVAPNGARKTRDHHATLPLTAEELAACAIECLYAGASMMHLHVRTEEGLHTLDMHRYEEAIAAVRSAVGKRMLIQITTEAVGMYTAQQQMEVVDALKPEAASVSIRELSRLQNEITLGDFFHRCAAQHTLLQYILYDAKDCATLLRFFSSGLIPEQTPSVLFVLGSYTEQREAQVDEIFPLLRSIPETWVWSICAFGRSELHCAAAAALLGGHIRIGFENNLLMINGEKAASNAALVKQTSNAIHTLGFEIATADTARALFEPKLNYPAGLDTLSTSSHLPAQPTSPSQFSHHLTQESAV